MFFLLLLFCISNTKDYKDRFVSKAENIYSPRFTLFHFDFDDEEHATIEVISFVEKSSIK